MTFTFRDYIGEVQTKATFEYAEKRDMADCEESRPLLNRKNSELFQRHCVFDLRLPDGQCLLDRSYIKHNLARFV
jgi:aminoglycoside phosphotransferase family enzyme